MSRVRWLAARWGVPLRDLNKALAALPFTNRSSEGFVVDRAQRDFIEARYIQKVELTETVVDPFGKELTFDRVSFNECRFRASLSSPGLEIIDGSRSSQSFLSALARATDFGFSVEPLSVDVLRWAERTSALQDGKVLIDSVQVGAIQIGPDVSARAVLKGSRDVRDAVGVVTGKRPHTVEKLRMRIAAGDARGSVVLSSTGNAAIEGFQPHRRDMLVRVVANALASTLEDGTSRFRKLERPS